MVSQSFQCLHFYCTTGSVHELLWDVVHRGVEVSGHKPSGRQPLEHKPSVPQTDRNLHGILTGLNPLTIGGYCYYCTAIIAKSTEILV